MSLAANDDRTQPPLAASDPPPRVAADPSVIVSYVLRVGVFSSAALLVVGMFFYLISVGGQAGDWRTTVNDVGDHSQLHHADQLLADLARFEPLAFVELGVIVLILTPLLRVAATVLIFARERDRLYVGITLVVLAVLLLGWFRLGGGVLGNLTFYQVGNGIRYEVARISMPTALPARLCWFCSGAART